MLIGGKFQLRQNRCQLLATHLVFSLVSSLLIGLATDQIAAAGHHLVDGHSWIANLHLTAFFRDDFHRGVFALFFLKQFQLALAFNHKWAVLFSVLLLLKLTVSVHFCLLLLHVVRLLHLLSQLILVMSHFRVNMPSFIFQKRLQLLIFYIASLSGCIQIQINEQLPFRFNAFQVLIKQLRNLLIVQSSQLLIVQHCHLILLVHVFLANSGVVWRLLLDAARVVSLKLVVLSSLIAQ